jgi:hypothetical protein
MMPISVATADVAIFSCSTWFDPPPWLGRMSNALGRKSPLCLRTDRAWGWQGVGSYRSNVKYGEVTQDREVTQDCGGHTIND